MSEKKVKISKRTIDALCVEKTRYIVMDDELAGFGVRIEPSGIKTYFIRYRTNGGGRKATQRLMSLGRHGNLTPEEARKLAKHNLGLVSAGLDPGGKRQEIRREMLISELIELYAEDGCYVQRGVRQGMPMKETTKKFTLARLRHHVLPLLGGRRVVDLNSGDIERFYKDVSQGKSANVLKGKFGKTKKETKITVSGGEGAARKVVRDLSAVFTFAQRRRIITCNPVTTAAVRKVDNQRYRFLSVKEFERIGIALDAIEAEGIANQKAVNIVRLWLLTGCRRTEITGLKWTEVDLKNKQLNFEETKTGRSIRPLGEPACAILAKIKTKEDSPYVFPAESGEGFFTGTAKIWPRIREISGFGKEVTPHVLRHSVGAIAASSGESLLIVGAILGHKNVRSTAIYAHVSIEPAISAATRVANTISMAMKNRTPNNVTEFRSKRLSKK